VVSAPGSTKTLKVLLGRSGSDESLAQLADGLRTKGYQVVENHTSPVGAHDTNDAVKQTLRGVDVVLLVVRGSDGSTGSAPPFDRVLHDARMIQNSIGDGRVLLLIEESVDGLPETGLGHIRFPTSRADRILDDVVSKIGPVPEPAAERDLHARVPMSEQARSSALRVPWFLVFVVLFSAAIPLAVALNSLRDTEPEPDLVTMTDVASGLAVPRSVADGGFGGVSGTTADAAGPAGAVVAATPASPATVGAGNALLPASCTVDLRKGSLLDGALECDGIGQLLLDGVDGPWHNEIGAVAVADGVVAELVMEPRSDGTTNGPPVVTVASGQSIAIDAADSAYGAQRMTVRFSANYQHVHFFRNRDGSGEFVTLTFVIDE
jgi:hypothetical protein